MSTMGVGAGSSSTDPESVSEESHGTLGGPISGARGQEEGQDGQAQTSVVGKAREQMLKRGSVGTRTTWLETTWGRSSPPPLGVDE